MLSSSEDLACKTYSYPRTLTALPNISFTLKMGSAQVVETSVTNNSPSQDSNHPDDLFQSRFVTPGFKPFSYKLDKLKRLKTGTWCSLVYLVKWRWLTRLRTLITGMVLFRRKRHDSNSWPWFLKLRSMPCLCPYKKKEWVQMRSIPRLTPI